MHEARMEARARPQRVAESGCCRAARCWCLHGCCGPDPLPTAHIVAMGVSLTSEPCSSSCTITSRTASAMMAATCAPTPTRIKRTSPAPCAQPPGGARCCYACCQAGYRQQAHIRRSSLPAQHALQHPMRLPTVRRQRSACAHHQDARGLAPRRLLGAYYAANGVHG